MILYVILICCVLLWWYHMVMVFRQIGQLKISLKSVLDQWSLYKQASEEINGYLMEGRYSVSRFRLLTGSFEAVRLQVQSLEVCSGFIMLMRLEVIKYPLLCTTVCKGFAGGVGETGEQCQKVWRSDTPAAERMSPISV